MTDKTFIYVTYIRTSPERVWEALTKPEFTRRYWFGAHQETDWKVGSPWKLVFADGRVADTGEVLESDPPRRLVIKWRNEFMPELKAEGYTRCTFEIERDAEVVKLTVIHEADRPHTLIGKVAEGWPRVLSSLKSLLETGDGLPRTDALPRA